MEEILAGTIVTSTDGTAIAFERSGKGPAVILVDGALCHRSFGPSRALAAELSRGFTVYAYDRRGRGESSDTQPYAVEREIEDIEALAYEAGGSVFLYGISSGAVLALKAAAILGAPRVAKLALYQPPLSLSGEAKQEFARYRKQMGEMLEEGRRGDALALFLADMMPAEMLEAMRQSPEWREMEALAPTLAYDNAVLGDGLLPVQVARAATVPALLLDGSESPAFFHEATGALARVMPRAQRIILQGQTHDVAPEAIAPVLREFFGN